MIDLRSTLTRTLMLLAASIFASGCGPEPVSDTGYVGTWERVAGPASRISLRREGDGYSFRWSLKHGDRAVRCEDRASAVCGEYNKGDKIYEWSFRVRQPEGSKELLIERDGKPVEGRGTPLHEVDRLELQPGGLELTATTIERNHEPLQAASTPYRFRKVSDKPF